MNLITTLFFGMLIRMTGNGLGRLLSAVEFLKRHGPFHCVIARHSSRNN